MVPPKTHIYISAIFEIILCAVMKKPLSHNRTLCLCRPIIMPLKPLLLYIHIWVLWCQRKWTLELLFVHAWLDGSHIYIMMPCHLHYSFRWIFSSVLLATHNHLLYSVPCFAHKKHVIYVSDMRQLGIGSEAQATVTHHNK